MCAFAAGLLVAGFLLRPVYGCWKRGATPTWALYSTGISCLIFAGLYTLVDVWRLRRWAAPLIPVGTNPLLAYLLADLTYPVLLVLGIDLSASGASGIIRNACLALGLFLLTSWLTAKKLLRVRI
jgi:predicted acyltransferase